MCRRQAVDEYMEKRDQIMTVKLGTANTDIFTTWSALYVYGSGRSDTLKDMLLR